MLVIANYTLRRIRKHVAYSAVKYVAFVMYESNAIRIFPALLYAFARLDEKFRLGGYLLARCRQAVGARDKAAALGRKVPEQFGELVPHRRIRYLIGHADKREIKQIYDEMTGYGDIGRELQSGAYLTGLVRTRIGEYKIDECLDPETFNEWLDSQEIEYEEPQNGN